MSSNKLKLTYEKRKISLEEITAGSAYSSSFGASTFGMFFHHYLAIALPWDLKARSKSSKPQDLLNELLTREQRLDKELPYLSSEQLVATVMEYAADTHEFRHLHDCFGTLWGLRLFNEHLEMFHGFVRMLKDLRASGTAALPLKDWDATGSAPESVHKFLGKYKAYEQKQALVRGGFCLDWQMGSPPDTDYILLEIEDLGCEIPAYATTVTRSRQQGEDITHEVVGYQIIPIGFEAIIEGIARQLQNFLILNRFGKEAVDAVEFELRKRVDPNAGLPYAVTDYMMARVFSRRGITLPPENFRDLLVGVSDYALSPWKGGLKANPSDRNVHPGWRFVEALEESSYSRENKIFAFKYPSSRKWCEIMVRVFSPLAQVNPKESFLKQLEAFVFRDFMLPLLVLRRDYGDGIMTDLMEYVEKFKLFPLSHIVMTKQGFSTSGKFSPEFYRVWTASVMLNQVSYDMVHNNLLICPRRRGEIQEYLAGENFADEPSTCDDEIARGCGVYSGGTTESLPRCAFRRLLEGFEFPRLSVTDAPETRGSSQQ